MWFYFLQKLYFTKWFVLVIILKFWNFKDHLKITNYDFIINKYYLIENSNPYIEIKNIDRL